MSEQEHVEKPQPSNGTAVAVPESPRPTIAAGPRGLEMKTLDDLWRFAKCVAASGLAPRGIETPEAILIAIQMGAELGLPPMSALQNIAVVNGRPNVWGDAMLGVCRASGLFDEEAFSETETPDHKTASCTVRRLPRGKPITRTFSIDDAKQAELFGKKGPWTQYPRRMLQVRARSWALRDGFSDILRGFRSVEEARDIIDAPSEAVEAPRSLAALTERLEAKAEAAPEPVKAGGKAKAAKLFETDASATESGA